MEKILGKLTAAKSWRDAVEVGCGHRGRPRELGRRQDGVSIWFRVFAGSGNTSGTRTARCRKDAGATCWI